MSGRLSSLSQASNEANLNPANFFPSSTELEREERGRPRKGVKIFQLPAVSGGGGGGGGALALFAPRGEEGKVGGKQPPHHHHLHHRRPEELFQQHHRPLLETNSKVDLEKKRFVRGKMGTGELQTHFWSIYLNGKSSINPCCFSLFSSRGPPSRHPVQSLRRPQLGKALRDLLLRR